MFQVKKLKKQYLLRLAYFKKFIQLIVELIQINISLAIDIYVLLIVILNIKIGYAEKVR